MKVEEEPTGISISVHATTPAASAVKKESSVAGFLGKSGYKFWVLAAILLLAFWSMFTGSVSLKWSSGNLARLSGGSDLPLHDDLDVLEVEEREKVVRKMWDVYAHSPSVRLQRFWLEAFEAAYEYLSSDVPGVREAAISEIAKLSMHSLHSDAFGAPSEGTRKTRENPDEHGKIKYISARGAN